MTGTRCRVRGAVAVAIAAASMHGGQGVTGESLLKMGVVCKSHGDDPDDEGNRRNSSVVIEREVPEDCRGSLSSPDEEARGHVPVPGSS